MDVKWGVNALKKNQKDSNLEYDDQEMMMGTMLWQKSGVDLIQNCDLPPPMKVFTGGDHKTVMSSMKKKRGGGGFDVGDVDDGSGKLGLLKALRLSQTRAREAEERYSAMAKEKDDVCRLLMTDSIRILGYKQLVRLLEIQVNMLEKENKVYSGGRCDDGDEDDGDDDDGNKCGLTLVMALTLCFGVAGFGFVIGCRYFWA